MQQSQKEIRLGVFGVFRGKSLMKPAKDAGFKITALCDFFEDRLKAAEKEFDAPGYTDFDEFIKQDFDAVLIANYFHQHAPYAIKALKHGKHVMSETTCAVTLAESVELYRAISESGLCYMLAENYCYTKFNLEMKKLYADGEIGMVKYAEGEYNHPLSPLESLKYSPGQSHWRRQLPPCFYSTHALAPLMYVTGTMPKEVSCSIIPDTLCDGRSGFVMLVRMDNGSVFRIMSGVAGHSCWYRFHGTKGAMECTRGPGYFGPQMVRIWHEAWDLEPGKVRETQYLPSWPVHETEAERAGHGGGDFFIFYEFAKAIRSGEKAYPAAYEGIMMSVTAILAWKSAHEGGRFIKIPDIADADAQKEMLKDRFSPFKNVENSELYPPEMRVSRELPPEKFEQARSAWKNLGFSECQIEEMLMRVD